MSPPRALVLMYHRVGGASRAAEEGDYALPAELFAAQMQRLAAGPASVISLSALAQGAYAQGSVALTFDDGCDTDATVAAPKLRALGFPAAFFVNPDRVGRDGRASWTEVRALADEGFLVGSHGLDHALLDELPPAELERQVVESRRRLEDRLGRAVEALSLPGGSGGERVRRAAQAAGYRLVLGSRPGLVRGPAAGGILPRLAMRRGHGLAGFAAAVEQRPLFLLGQAARHRAGRALRFFLGAGTYRRLRVLWLQKTRGAPWS